MGSKVNDALNLRRRAMSKDVDEGYIESYMSDSRNYFTQAKSDIDGLTWESATNTDKINSRKASGTDLLNRSNKIRAYLNVHKDSIDKDTYNNWMAQLDADKKNYSDIAGLFDSAYDDYSRYENQQHYDIYHMSFDELRAKIDSSAKAPSQADMQAAENRSKTVNGRSRNPQASDKRTAYDARSREYQKETKENFDGKIAYTTKSGQNITWQDLYDQKLGEQTLRADYAEYSSRANWDEYSQELSNPYLLDSDWQLMYSITSSNVPYRLENAKELGYTETQWKMAKDKRDYIAEKYNLDLSNREKTNAILGEKMDLLQSKQGELATFDHIDLLTDEEKDILYYIANMQGRNAALKWYKNLEGTLAERHKYDLSQRMYGIGEDFPVIGSVFSLGSNLAAGGEALIDSIDYLRTGEMGYNNMALATNSLRGGVSSIVDWNVGNHDLFDIAYGGLMSGLDSAIANGLGGIVGPGMQGLSAFGYQSNEAIDKGLTDEQAFNAGFSAGTNELLFEALSLGKLKAFEAAEVWKKSDALKNLGKLAFVNATEEMATDVANMLYDRLAHGDSSDYALAVRNYMDSGMTQAEAKAQVVWDNIDQVLQSGVLGGLIGLSFGGAGAISQFTEGAYYDNLSAEQRNFAAGKISGSEKGLSGLKDVAAQSVEGSSGRTANRVKRLSAAVDNNPTIKNVAKLYGAVENANIAKNKSDIASALTEKGVSQKRANEIADTVVKLNRFGGINADNVNLVVDDIISTVYGPDSKAAKQIADSLIGVDLNTGNMVETSSLTSGAYGQEIKISKRMAQEIETATNAVSSVLNEMVLNESSAMGQRQAALSNLEAIAATEQLATELEKQGVAPETAAKIADVVATAQSGGDLSSEANQVLQVVQENPKLAKALQSATEAINMSAEDAFRDLGNRYSGGNQVIASMPKLQQDTFARIYDSKVNGTAVQFADAMAAAYALGYDNRAMNLEGVDGALLATLTEAQRQFAWKEGRSVAASDAKSAQKTMDSVYKKAEKALKKSGSNAAVTGKVTTKGISVNKMNPEQKASYDLAQQIAPAVKADIVVYKGGKEWGFYDHKTDSIHLNANAKWNNHNMMVFALAHELVHRAKKGSPMQFKAFSDFLLEQYGKQGADIDAMIGQQMAAADRFDQTAAEADKIRMTPEMALEEVICDAAQRMLLDTDAGKKLAQWGAQSQQNKGFLEKVKSIIQDILNLLRSALKGVDPDSLAAQEFGKMEANAKKILADMFVDMSIDAGEKLSTIKAAADAGHDFAKQYLATKNVQYNLAATESHKAKLQEKYSDESTVSLETLMNRYDKILSIWKKLGGELDSKFLNDWNSKKGKDRAFTIFKAQAGYKYNVELSSMCKKGVPLFEAIDTIVKNEVMKELGSNVLGKAEKEILYDILKQHHFEIPCAICYVEQARQREGVIIDAFLNGNAEKAKLGWNQVLDQVQAEMAKRGVEYSFPQVSRDIATDEYTVRNEDMDQKTQDAFYEALRTVANQEISRYNKTEGKSRKLLKDASPESVKECFKGTLPANLKLFKVLFAEPNSRFKIESDLLYSSRTTQNLAMAHNQLYSLFNSQGGVSGYKTKQGTTVYWGDILSKTWRSATLRKEGGVRNQSNSDFQMYTLLDQVQMYMDFSAKGYYLQAYTKVLSELKLFGLSRGKINASLIPSVVVYKNADGSVNVEKTMENAGLDEKGNPIYDDFEGINHKEAFMLIGDPEYSKNIGGVCIGYSDNHIKKLLDDDRVQLIIGFHDKTNDPNKRYRGARYAKNYNGINEAVRKSDGKTVHIGFNSYVKKAENKFHYDADLEVFEGSTTFDGKTYTADDIPRLAADLYLADCEKKGYDPAYNIEGIVDHPNYYKLLADFSLYNSQGYYAPHQKVAYNMPDTVPFLDANGNKQTMRTEDYIKAELEKELVVRDDIAAALADESSEGIIPQFKAAVAKQNGARSYKLPTVDSDPYGDFDYLGLNWAKDLGIITSKDTAIFERTINNEILRGAKPKTAYGEYIIDTGKCLMFTNGDFHAPTLSCVVVFETEYESLTADAKELIYNDAKVTGDLQKSIEAIEKMFRPGFACIYYPGVGATNGWQNGRGKGNNSGQPYRRNRPRSLKEILAHQGIKNFKLPVGEDMSPRAVLASALEEVAQTDIERKKLQEYKDAIDSLNELEEHLREVKGKIKEMSFAKGPRDRQKLIDLRGEATRTENRINLMDKRLLRLEAAKPLQDVLDREKQRITKREKQKGREALQRYREKTTETREKRTAVEKLQKLVIDTSNWLSHPAKTDVKCPDILKQPYANFLQNIDLSSQRLSSGGDPTKKDLRLANAMSSLATAVERIMNAQDPSKDMSDDIDAGFLDLPKDFVQELRKKTEAINEMMGRGEYVVNVMTAKDVRELSQMIRTLNHAIKEIGTLYANNRFANVKELGAESVGFMDALGAAEKTGGIQDFISWDNALPIYAFKRFGKGGESVFEGLMDAQDKLAFLAQDIFNFRNKAWTDNEASDWSNDTHTIKLPDGEDLTLTTADAMSIYCLSRREQGLKHLLGGGTRVIGLKKGSKKAKDSRSTLTIKDIDTIISSLSDRQKQVAESIQEFMSTVCAEWGNEISMKRFLTREFTEKFYFPIESNDENLQTKDPAAQQSDLFRLLNISATKAIDPNANNEVIIRNIFDVFTNHASDMARLNAYGMPILDYMKWLNYRNKTVNENGQIDVSGVRKSMNEAYGDAAFGYALNLIKDVNGRPSDGGLPSFYTKMVRNAKTAMVGSSLRVATLQLTSYPRASLVLSAKSLAIGITKLPNIDKAKKYCGIALWKSFGFYETNISRSIEDQIKGVKNIQQKLIELSLKGAEWGDAITWGALWNACEYEVAQTTQNKIGSEAFYQEVGAKLREVVYKTQVVDSTLTRSQMMRSKDTQAQSLSAFMSEPTLSANILMDAGFEFSMEARRTGSKKLAWKKTRAYIGKACAVYVIGQITAALLEALWDAWRDDEDEEFAKKYWNAFFKNLALDIIPFNKIPIISDVAEAALSLVKVGYFSSDSLSSTTISQTVSAINAWGSAFNEESPVTIYNAIYKTVRAGSSLFGVSASGLMREVVALWNNTAGEADVTLKIRMNDPSDEKWAKESLEAIIEGDDKQSTSIREKKFNDDKSYQKSMRSAIKQFFDDEKIGYDAAEEYLVDHGGLDRDKAHWTMKEWEYEKETEGEYKKYAEFYAAVETGKDLKKTIKTYTDNGVSKENLKGRITDNFKPIYINLSRGDQLKMRGYLINAFVACGDTREQAMKKIDKWE